MGRIFRLWEVSGDVLDGEQSCGAVVDSRIGDDCGLEVRVGELLVGLPLPPHHHHHLIIFPLLLVPSQNGPTSVGQRPKPLSNNNIGEKKLQLKSGEEERKRVIRWLLWECWKLRFPEALGIPHWSWNLWARKTRPESHQSGDVIQNTAKAWSGTFSDLLIGRER